MTSNGAQAVAWANAHTVWPYGQCLGFVRSCFGVGPRDHDAALSWARSYGKHATWPPPAGVPVFWVGGSHGYGHVALSIGAGNCRSTDVLRSGHINSIPISLVHQAWGETYVGWSEYIEGVRITSAVPAATPVVDLSNVVAAFHADPSRPQGIGSHELDVYRVEAALRVEGLLPASYAGDGYAGTLTRTAYRAWQYRCGYSGAGADGYPGMASLTKLGARHGFRVVA